MALKLGLPFIKLTSKLKNHHHRHYPHQSEPLSASLQSFWSDVSAALILATSNSTPGLESRSLQWIGQCLEQLLAINTGFAKLVVDIDCPVSEWGAVSVEEYLTHSLHLLDFLNSISSSLSQVSQSRLALSHALNLLGNSSPSMIHRLRPIKLSENCNRKGCMKKDKKQRKEKVDHGKEEIVHEALAVMRIAGFLVCGIVLSNLSGDGKPYFELVKSTDSVSKSSFNGFDWRFLCNKMTDEGGAMREVKEVNNAVACLVAAIDAGEGSTEAAAKELHQSLEVLQKQLESIGKEVDCLFSDVLAGRNELLQSLRQEKKQ